MASASVFSTREMLVGRGRFSLQECPIYDEFDWNLPGRTFGVVVASVVAYFIVAGIYTAFAPRSRDQDFKGIEKDKETGQFHTISL